MKNGEDSRERDELFSSSVMMMVVTLTICSAALIAEIFIMDWEKWAVLLITAGVVFTWYLHFRVNGSEMTKIWICAVLMMAIYFFYGTHETSTFDLAVVLSVVVLQFTMTGVHSLITLCQVTYYLTMVYALFNLASHGTEFSPLLISRTALHFFVVTLICWIARRIIDKWNDVLHQADEQILTLTESTVRLNDFIANVSHEIRTPINAILGICGMGLADEKDEEKRANLRSIENAGKKIGEQISDILDYSEIDRKDLANNYEDYMLSSVINDLVNELSDYRRNDIELIIDVDAAIPSVMNTDVGKLKKILWHLISNSLKYTNEGGVYVHLSSIPHDYGINLCIEVTDTGIGMDAGQLEKIYDSFYKADSGRDRRTGGLGLGMRIVHGFVRSLGGFMTVESELGKGTSVRISIPNKVIDPSECMSVKDRDRISLGAYLHFEKYSDPNVREFYDTMVRNIVTGMKVAMHRVDNTEALQALVDNKKLTHLFAGPEEYASAADLMEDLARDIMVIIVANPGELDLPPHSRVRIMPKPFYCFPVVGVLNSRPDEETGEEGSVTFPGARVLVVDDEPMNLIVSSEMFRRYGMTVTTCESGQKAVELCHDSDYEIIFMDHMMPVMDGVEAMKRIRADRSRDKTQTPIIAFTANAVSTAKEMFKQEGFDGFVGKPVDRVELERVLRRLLPSSFVKVENVKPGEDASRPVRVQKDDVKIKEEPPKKDGENLLFNKLSAIGVDIEKGLFYCQNDRQFYETLLAQYAAESEGKLAAMKKDLASGDLSSYAIQVHSIKSTSKMIGAMTLSESARELELAAKNGNRPFIDENHEPMLALYEKVLSVIRPEAAHIDTSTADDAPIEFGASEGSGVVFEFDPDAEETKGGDPV